MGTRRNIYVIQQGETRAARLSGRGRALRTICVDDVDWVDYIVGLICAQADQDDNRALNIEITVDAIVFIFN
jgi:hypothetical protein